MNEDHAALGGVDADEIANLGAVVVAYDERISRETSSQLAPTLDDLPVVTREADVLHRPK